MSGGSVKKIDLGNDFGAVIVKVNGDRIAVGADGSVIVYPAANDVTPRVSHTPEVAPEIGAIQSTGEHKGEIYGGIYPADNNPIWFLAAPKSMDHFNAASWATEQGGALPTRKQGDYLTTLKGKLEICPAKPDGGGAFTELFNRGGSFPAGYVWLAEPNTNNSYYAWCQRLSGGDQHNYDRFLELPVLCVIR